VVTVGAFIDCQIRSDFRKGESSSVTVRGRTDKISAMNLPKIEEKTKMCTQQKNSLLCAEKLFLSNGGNRLGPCRAAFGEGYCAEHPDQSFGLE
jgi:hypothetical protein